MKKISRTKKKKKKIKKIKKIKIHSKTGTNK